MIVDIQRSSELSVVFIGHWVRSSNVGFRVEVDGKLVEIWGHSTSLMPVRSAEVLLLSEESTPAKWHRAANAEEEFVKAAATLVREGIEFYSVLKRGWTLPALHWTREYR